MIRRALRVLLRVALAIAAVVALLLVAVGGGAWLGWRGEPDPVHSSIGRNAVWLDDRWRLAGEFEALDADQLLEQLNDNAVTDAFLTVGIARPNGTIPQRNHRHLDAALDRLAGRGVRIHAAIGGVDVRSDGFLRLDDDATLDGLVATAEAVVAMGFDGVVLEVRPWRSGDGRLLGLLDRVRAATATAGAELTVTAPPPEPLPGVGAALDAVGDPRTWSDDYHVEVVGRVDSVLVRMYEVRSRFDWVYGTAVARSTQTMIALHRGAEVQLFVELLPGDALGAGIRGVQKGLEEGDAPQLERVGIALLGDPADAPGGWREWRRRWLGPR